MFIVEIATTSGHISETFPTYEEAKRRVDQVPQESLAGIPFIFQELPDGSQRLVRDDLKPLQWHRLPEDPVEDESVPLTELEQVLEQVRAADEDDEPIALIDLPPDVEGEGRPAIKVIWARIDHEGEQLPPLPEGAGEPPGE